MQGRTGALGCPRPAVPGEHTFEVSSSLLLTLALAVALQDAPVQTAPAVVAEPPPPVQLVPAPPPLAVPAPPLDPIEELLGTDESEEAEPAPTIEPEPEPQLLPAEPPPAASVPPAPTLPLPRPAAPIPTAPIRPEPGASLPTGPQPYRATPTPAEPAPNLPTGPRPYLSLPPTPAPRASVRPYEAPRNAYELPSVAEQRYEAGVRSSAQAAQSQQGRLDGSWLVAGVDGARLYFLQLVDQGAGAVEGAWRDANGLPGVRSGFLASAAREGAGLTLRFFERSGAAPVTLTLRPGGDGRAWSGELDRNDGRRSVTMRPQ